MKAVFGIAKTESQAITIANRLKESGFSPNDISMLLPDKSGPRDFEMSFGENPLSKK